MPALPQSLNLARSLRPLRRRVASTTTYALDEIATAQASAAARRWLPRLAPKQARWLDLALVIDESPSMVVWRRTGYEIRRLFEQLGAFRDVRTWFIDTGLHGSAEPVLRNGRDGLAGHGSARHDRRELLSPDGRCLVLVFTDCVGPAWRDGTLLRWLESWGRVLPTAILQPLPQRMWNRCSLDVARVRLAAPAPGAPNARLRVELRDVDLVPSGVAVPVMEVDPRWLTPWAALIAGRAQQGIWGAATFTGWSPRERLFHGADPAERAPADAAQAIRQFRAGATPQAYELARYLAAAPLSLPVMRLVQSVMLPDSRPRHLAELFLSPLLRRVTAQVAHEDPERVLYDFQAGVREYLTGTLRPETGLEILARVSDFIGHRLGGALDFPAVLAGAELPQVVDDASRPFAEVAQTVLRTLGGRYRELADRLATVMQHEPGPPFAGRVTRSGLRADELPSLDNFVVNPRKVISGGAVTDPKYRSDGTDQPTTNQPMVWGGVPPRNPNFTGRQELLTDLRRQLTSKVTALLPHTLHGLGGVGKTQLAVEYVYRYASEYDVVWWVPSEQAPLIRQSLLSLAPRLQLNVGAGDDVAQTLTAIDDALRLGRPYRRWLLVFDNADRAEDLAPFLSNATGHILITSRNRSWGNVAETVEVDVFERQESVDLLSRRLPTISAEDADKLADKLGDLPLALEQAAAWQAATATPASEYLRLLDEQVGALLSESKPSDYPEPVAAAWGLAFNQLTVQTPAGLQLLELCAFLGSEPISVRLLREGRHIALPSPLAEVIPDDIQMRRAIRDIGRYGLARVDSSRNSLQVHRLVQAVLRDRVTQEQRQNYRVLVHALLAAANPGDPGDDQTWPRHAELSTHVGPAGLVDGETTEIRKVVLDQIRYQYLLGDFESSRELAETALTSWRAHLGRDHEQTLVAGRLLGNALRSIGRIEEARTLNEEILARTRSVFGSDHEHTLVTANSVGADLRLRGEWRRALELDTEMLALHRQVFGEDDPSTLLSANNLAVDYRLLGQFVEARDVDQDTRNRLQQTLGADHPYTLRIVSNLSRDYYGLGEYKAAIDLQRRSLPTHRNVLGTDHAEVLRATRIHVVTLRKLGFLLEAEDLATELVATSRRRLGDNHPDTIVALMTQSNCLAAVERPREARVAGEDALFRMRELLGRNHPFTYATMTNVATVLRGMGDYTAARSLDEQALAGFRGALPADHTYVLCTSLNLSNDVALAHDHAAARAMGETVLASMVRAFGPTHPQTLVCTLNLSLDLAALGQSAEAMQMREDVIGNLREVLGPDHPETISAENGVRASIEIEPPNP